MPRSIVLGNGKMLINLDKKGHLQDFYFPHVGMEDHTTYGHYHKTGLFDEDNGQFSWIDGDDWQSIKCDYKSETMVSEIVVRSEKMGVEILIEDFVHPSEDFMCRRFHIKNLQGHPRNLKMFYNFDFHMYGVKGNDTAYYHPRGNYMIFYKFNRYFLINGKSNLGGIEDYTTGKSEYKGLEGTWKDAEDGHLQRNPIEQGSIDATIGFRSLVKAHSESVVEIWICAGENAEEVKNINKLVKATNTKELMHMTEEYWRSWVNKQEFNFNGIKDQTKELFKKSLIIVRTQIDNGGAIIAANDTDIMRFNKDTYSYMWPRDGALVAKTLDSAGYSDVTRKFFRFCKEAQTKEGYLLHKYNPDGSVGSSWHPWIENGEYQVPLQEDETALPLIALANHYEQARDIEFIKEMYDGFVVKAADFLVNYLDPETQLPLPSYDLWEQFKGIFTFTCSTVYGGLIAAGKLAHVMGQTKRARRYNGVAKHVKQAILEHLYCEKEETFVKKINPLKDGGFDVDYQTDASIAGIFMFGVLPPDDPRVVKTMQRIKDRLTVRTDIGGLARYEGDRYQAVSHEDYPEGVPGNPWIITTLWYAQWLLMIADGPDTAEFKEAGEILKWVEAKATPAGILAEQMDPFTGEPLSVSPLTWSHSTYINTVILYRKRLTDFGVE